jgi:hypothetical protein
MECKINRYVNAPVETVFRCATDLQNAPKRISGIVKLEVLTGGPVRQGTRFRETRIMFKREATEEMEITAFDPPRSYAVDCESCGCRCRTEFKFSASGSGTEMSVTFTWQPLTFFAKMMSFMTKPMLKACIKAFEKDMDELKASIERESAVAGVA